ILSVVRMIAKNFRVFPAGCKLNGVQCDLSNPFTEGGYANIIKGEYRGHSICVKAVRLYKAEDSTASLQVKAKEYALWAHLSHPNILTFYGVYVPPNSSYPRICLVSRWMNNGDLKSYLRKVSNSPRTLLLFDVITGLKYLHENGIIHADLKATNVLIPDIGHAVICDFGISRIKFSTTNPISTGTHNWTSPELILQHENIPSEKSDIWSFGCLCYEVLAGKEPFYCCLAYPQLFLAMMNGKNPLDASSSDTCHHLIPPCMQTLLRECWHSKPSDRPTSRDIYEQFRQLGIPDNRLPAVNDDAVLREVRKARTHVEIDYDEVQRILERVSN
ncbi:hypothetical protein AN958_01396, partial [Leucoagaricus sp. SymC.cos]